MTGWSWDFGDGGTSSGQEPQHSYMAGGTYDVTLTVTDNDGAMSTPVTQPVTVVAANQSPVAVADVGTVAEGGTLSNLVITSYSIHYTKLYETANGLSVDFTDASTVV